MMNRLSYMIFLLAIAVASYAQEDGEKDDRKRNRILVGIGHMHVSQGIDVDGNKAWVSVPVWMIDYDYSITSKWTLGIRNDIITETFKVEGFFLGEEKE